MKGHKIMNYKHISINKRFYITNFLNLGQSIRKISKHLNRNASTISRKNYINEKYLAHIANEAYINNKMNYVVKVKSSTFNLHYFKAFESISNKLIKTFTVGRSKEFAVYDEI